MFHASYRAAHFGILADDDVVDVDVDVASSHRRIARSRVIPASF